jgi:hypothetical protein
MISWRDGMFKNQNQWCTMKIIQILTLMLYSSHNLLLPPRSAPTAVPGEGGCVFIYIDLTNNHFIHQNHTLYMNKTSQIVA